MGRMGKLSKEQLQALHDDWIEASNTAIEAEVEALAAITEHHRNRCDETKARMVLAVAARNAAHARVRVLVDAIWQNPL
jgi:hypothetical protein